MPELKITQFPNFVKSDRRSDLKKKSCSCWSLKIKSISTRKILTWKVSNTKTEFKRLSSSETWRVHWPGPHSQKKCGSKYGVTLTFILCKRFALSYRKIGRSIFEALQDCRAKGSTWTLIPEETRFRMDLNFWKK